MRPVIVVPATPTTNGTLHVGHLAGPYLAADVYARFERAAGHQVCHATVTDDSQSYVVTSARRLGTTPRELVASATAEIEDSLNALGALSGGLPPIDDVYRRTVLDFIGALHESGRFQRRTVALPYAVNAKRFLYDALMTGSCPVCLAASSGGTCESCGHPNTFAELLDLRYTDDPTDTVVTREHEILVLPLEDYRDRLAAYYATRTRSWRPHARALIDELMARPLPEIPVTIPGDWGIPAPFAPTQGQVLYPWVEAMPAVVYATWWFDGGREPSVDALWLAERDPRIVYFHGFDNVFHWGLLDLALLLAHGDRYALPENNVCNEFYELDGEKFSTSRGHLVTGSDLLAKVPRDLVRFHLCADAPETQRSNYTEAGMHDTVTRGLVEPWNRLSDRLDQAGSGLPQATTASGRHQARLMADRFRLGYAVADFSPRRVAETLTQQLDRVSGSVELPLGDLLLQVRTIVAFSAPILIDVAAALTDAGVDLALDSCAATEVPMFTLPRLPVLGGVMSTKRENV
ncbi:MAG: class I tRNA ligase family protein [Actinomycetota bacterium]|nr:class I tRNA ligase family protein [Actinomycetota bacterium]